MRFTYLPLSDGENLYLATVIDCYSRRLVGWAVADHMRTEPIEDALSAARATRGEPGRGDVPLRPRLGLHLGRLRPSLRRSRGHQSIGAVGSTASARSMGWGCGFPQASSLSLQVHRDGHLPAMLCCSVRSHNSAMPPARIPLAALHWEVGPGMRAAP